MLDDHLDHALHLAIREEALQFIETCRLLELFKRIQVYVALSPRLENEEQKGRFCGDVKVSVRWKLDHLGIALGSVGNVLQEGQSLLFLHRVDDCGDVAQRGCVVRLQCTLEAQANLVGYLQSHIIADYDCGDVEGGFFAL